MGRALVLMLTLAVVGLTAAVATAHRKPTKNEATAINKAAHSSSATHGVGCFRTRQIVVSTAGPWAKASLVPCKPNTDTALAVFERKRGHWSLRDLGTSGVGCTLAPRAVRRDLSLSCP
jgi:hypothetical protein